MENKTYYIKDLRYRNDGWRGPFIAKTKRGAFSQYNELMFYGQQEYKPQYYEWRIIK